MESSSVMVSMNLDCAIGDEWCGSLSRRERHVLMGRLRGRVMIRTRRWVGAGGWVDGSLAGPENHTAV